MISPILPSGREASSTCELVYDLIRMMDGDADMTPIWRPSFMPVWRWIPACSRTCNTTARVHEIAANLMHKGIHVEEIHNNVYNQYGENRLGFIGYMLKDKMQILPEYRTAFMTISMKEAEEYKLSSGDKEGIVNLPLAMKDVDIAVLFTGRQGPHQNIFRSKGRYQWTAWRENISMEADTGTPRWLHPGSVWKKTVQILHTALAAFLS